MLGTLKLTQFRCFDALKLTLSPGVSAFIGANAQGKTSILEAVCVLLRLQSPRTASLNDLIQFDQTGFGLSGRWQDHDLRVINEPRKRRKLYHQDEEIARSRDYLQTSGLVVWMGNDDLALINGSGNRRRRYMDFLASQWQLDYRTTLRGYDKALRSRNQLLKEARQANWREIDAYTQVLFDHGNRLTAYRRELISRLAPHIQSSQQAISATKESLALQYHSGSGEDFAQTLEENRERDLRRGQTNAGPHRDDLEILINDRPADRFASEGQQRTIALALKLAQIELLRDIAEQTPVLLIDDIFGELDPERRHALIHALPAASQKLLTTTSLSWLPDHQDLQAEIYQVAEGAITVKC